MPTRSPTFPSFSLVLSKRDSFTLPDYYRTTRFETYGPYFRTTQPARDLMKTIDHRGRESVEFDPNFLLHERDFDRVGLDRRSEREDIESVHDEANEGQHKGSAWFWRLISSALRKCRGHKASVKNVGVQVDSST